MQEQKQAIINQAVTRGLDPEVELKDSGLAWLGPIPKHWKKDKIFRLFVNIGSGTTPHNGNAFFYQNGTIPWVNSGDLYAGGKFISNIAKKVSPSALLDYSVLKLYPVNTIVIAMYGGSIGNMGILQEEACCNQACCCLASTRKDFFLDFAFYLLSSYKNYWIEKSNGGGQPNISQEIIKQTWVGLPPRSEQAEIVIYLDKKVKDFDILLKKMNGSISTLVEYKNSLIAAVVTGKVDVRNIAVEAVSAEDLAPSDDPDESEEPDSTIPEESEE